MLSLCDEEDLFSPIIFLALKPSVIWSPDLAWSREDSSLTALCSDASNTVEGGLLLPGSWEPAPGSSNKKKCCGLLELSCAHWYCGLFACLVDSWPVLGCLSSEFRRTTARWWMSFFHVGKFRERMMGELCFRILGACGYQALAQSPTHAINCSDPGERTRNWSDSQVGPGINARSRRCRQTRLKITKYTHGRVWILSRTITVARWVLQRSELAGILNFWSHLR